MAVRTKAIEVEAVARELIPLYHPHLSGFRMEYAFLDKTPTRGGKETWGSARRATGLTAYLAGQEADEDEGIGNESFFVIEISGPIWKDLDADQRRALVDHQLCHCGAENDEDGNAKPVVKQHDLEEFVDVFKRHGNWSADIKLFEKAGLQPALPFHAATDAKLAAAGPDPDPDAPTEAELQAAGVNTLPDTEPVKPRTHKKRETVTTEEANGAEAPNGAKAEYGVKKDPHVPNTAGFPTPEQRRDARTATSAAQAAAALATN